MINPAFLRDPRDTDRLEAGLAVIRHAAASAAFTRVCTAEAWPGLQARTSAGLRDYIRGTVGSYYHPAA